MESRESLPVESGIQLKESGFPLTIGIQNPNLLGFCTWNLESKA